MSRDARIVCIWYPSGGFGHYINAVLSCHGDQFVSSPVPIKFGSDGNCHAFPSALPKYLKNPKNYHLPSLEKNKNYTVLIDNGIDDETVTYRDCFPGSTTIKICYDDRSWPIVALTMIEKAMMADIANELPIDDHLWPTKDPWATREKYFLYLRDHEFRCRWRPDPDCHNIYINQLLDYDVMLKCLGDFGVGDTFRSDWNNWFDSNSKYIKPILMAQKLIYDRNVTLENLGFLSVWEQAVINYYIWLRHGVEIPANDFADWFVNTTHLYDTIANLKNDRT